LRLRAAEIRIPFSQYERNGFLSLGAKNICGITITFMVRPDLHRPAGAAAQQQEQA
jgi:hypothetical protein